VQAESVGQAIKKMEHEFEKERELLRTEKDKNIEKIRTKCRGILEERDNVILIQF
jgi:hypothetical protein